MYIFVLCLIIVITSTFLHACLFLFHLIHISFCITNTHIHTHTRIITRCKRVFVMNVAEKTILRQENCMKIYRGCNARFQYRILRKVLVPKYWYMCNVMMQIIILFLGTCIVHIP